MNFIGHAKVALWTTGEPAFVLGAMLPDFASMAKVRLGAVEHPDMARGVWLHHRTDEVFHGSAPFLALVQETVAHLTGRGVERGPARAVGHIGVELLIDGELVQDHEVRSAYLSALAWAELPNPRSPTASDPSLRRLVKRLTEHGIPYDYQQPEAVTTRLGHILAGRPRLALSAEALRVVGSIMPDVKGRVQQRLPELIDALTEGLSHRRYS